MAHSYTAALSRTSHVTRSKWLHFCKLFSSSDKGVVRADGQKRLPQLGGEEQGKARLPLTREALQDPRHAHLACLLLGQHLLSGSPKHRCQVTGVPTTLHTFA